MELKNEIGKLDLELKNGLAGFNIEWQGDVEKVRKELLKKHVYPAKTSRFASLLFRSSRTPDCRKWSVLWFLFRGENSAEKAHFSVLEFLFRYRREGTRTSLLCFPFVTVNGDEKSSEWSFLYRILHFRNSGGRRSGHILFVPFGEK